MTNKKELLNELGYEEEKKQREITEKEALKEWREKNG